MLKGATPGRLYIHMYIYNKENNLMKLIIIMNALVLYLQCDLRHGAYFVIWGHPCFSPLNVVN
jgi:hypothetical protein